MVAIVRGQGAADYWVAEPGGVVEAHSRPRGCRARGIVRGGRWPRVFIGRAVRNGGTGQQGLRRLLEAARARVDGRESCPG